MRSWFISGIALAVAAALGVGLFAGAPSAVASLTAETAPAAQSSCEGDKGQCDKDKGDCEKAKRQCDGAEDDGDKDGGEA